MKTIITMAFASFLFFSSAQDTLDCKKDLRYDKKEKFYYKKGDESKTPVSGNAVCHPKKRMINRGKLVDGKWNGSVVGYKNDKVIGRAHYKNGLYDGLTVCYTETGNTKDSTIYNDGSKIYSYTAKYGKSGHRTQVTERHYSNNTIVYTYYETLNDMTYISQVNRYKGSKKDGVQEFIKGQSDAPGSLLTYTYEEHQYDNGDLKTITYYDSGAKTQVNDYVDGKAAMQNDISADGKVAASYPLKHGKKHGTAIIYGSEKPVNAEYSKGKLVTKK